MASVQTPEYKVQTLAFQKASPFCCLALLHQTQDASLRPRSFIA
jgi:hypothetical protein